MPVGRPESGQSMRPRFILDPQDPSGRLFDTVGAEADVSLNPAVSSDDGPRFAGASSEISLTSPFFNQDSSHDSALDHAVAPGGGQITVDAGIAISVQDADTTDPTPPAVLDEAAFRDGSGAVATVVLSISAMSSGANAILATPAPGLFATPMAHAGLGDGGATQAAGHADFQPFPVSLNAAFPAHGGHALISAAVSADLPAAAPAAMAELVNPAHESSGAVTSSVGAGG